MGIRITTRSRPRTDRPIPYEETTAAAAAADDLLTGPFTLGQVCELLYRVKKVRVVGSIAHDRYIEPPPEEEPFTEASTTEIDEVLDRWYGNGIDYGAMLSEIEIFRDADDLIIFESESSVGSFYTYPSDVKKDESGGYWLRFNFTFTGAGAGDGYFSSDLGIVGDTIDFDATFTLGGADFSIPAKALALTPTAASLTVAVEEWWPYATSAGAAAWNTTTGAPVNGGPGA